MERLTGKEIADLRAKHAEYAAQVARFLNHDKERKAFNAWCCVFFSAMCDQEIARLKEGFYG
jgi:hypothetical protein